MKKATFLLAIFLFSINLNAEKLSPQTLVNKGVEAYCVQTNAPLALNYFNQALEIDENYVPALIALGDYYTIHCAREKANEYLLRAVQNNRDSEYAIHKLQTFYTTKSEILREEKYLKNILPKITNNFVRLVILNYLSDISLSLGKINDGKQYGAKLNQITNWMIVGGFDNNERTGLNKSFGPEDNLALNQTYEGKEWELKWRPAFPLDRFGHISLEIIQPRKWITTYLRTGFIAPQATSAVIQLSFSGAFRVWLNGKPVAQNDKYNYYEDFMYRIPLELIAGTNILVFKLCTENNGYTFASYLTSPNNSPLFLKCIQPDDKTIPLTCEKSDQWEKPLLTPGTEYWKKISETNGNLYSKLMYGKYLFAVKMFDKAIKHFEPMSKANKLTPVELFCLGKSYVNKDCASQGIAAFREAVKIDPEAAGIQTKIASHYLDRELYDLAQPILDDILAKSSNCLNARLKLIELYENRDWNEDAYRLAKETAEIFPDNVVVQQKVYSTAASRDSDEICEKALKKALSIDYDRYYPRTRLADLYFSQRRLKEFFKQVDILENLFPTEPTIVKNKIKAYISLRDASNAYAACNQALKFFPDKAIFHSYLGDVCYMNNQRDKAIAAYHTALKYSPDYLWLRRYLDFLEGRDQAFFDKYALSDEQAKALVIKNNDIQQSSPEEISRIIFEQMLVQVFKDGSSRHFVHLICKVLHPKGVKDYSSVDLPGGFSSRLLKAVTYKKDGRIIEATHLDSGQIEFPDVQVGDTIEYKTMYDRYGGSWMDEHFYSTYTFDYNQSKVDREELVIAMPSNMPVRVFYNPPRMICSNTVFKANFVRQWILTNIPMYHSEPVSPPYYDVANRVSISTITNWSFIADWERGMISEIENGNAHIKSLTEKITEGATSDIQKIKAVFNYITENFRYTQMYENNIAKIKPHPIPDILANKCGDCKDLALLMVQMLKSLNIKADTVLLRTADRGQILKDVPAPDLFNHVIVYVPGIGKNGMFIDPTYRLGEFNLLPSADQNVLALVIKDKGYKLIRTPLLPPENSMSHDYICGEIFDDGILTGSVVSTIFNNDAARLRSAFERIPKLKNIGSYIAGQIDPSAQLLTFDLFNRKAHSEKPLIITLDFNAPQFGRKNDGTITFSLPFQFKSMNYLQGLETRTLPIKFDQLSNNSCEYKFKIPENYTVIIPEENVEFKNEFGAFNFNTSIKNNVLTINWKIIIAKQLVQTDEYSELRDFLNRCSHVTSQVITLKKKSENSSRGFLEWLF